jgi:hypothetical protein
MSTNNLNKLMFGAAVAAAMLFGACANETTDSSPEPKLCECPNGTEHDEPCACGGEDCVCTVKPAPVCECPVKEHKNLPTDICCEGEDCACTVKRVYNLTFGKRPVVLNASESGLAQATVDAAQEGLIRISSYTNVAGTFSLNRPGVLTINVVDDDIRYMATGLDSFSVGKSALESDMLNVLAGGIMQIHWNKDTLSLMQQFNGVKETVRLAFQPLGVTDTIF